MTGTDAGEWKVWSCSPGESIYPHCLLDTPDPPGRLWGIGDPALLRPGLAVIGSRRATPYGLACARRFAGLAARHDVVIVSGGASGCDTEAHRAALDASGSTVAVLGCGPDVDYPQTEARTLSRIRRDGCVIAELPPLHQPRRWAFPRRNRIIAGLAYAVLVVEAGLPSGTFSTADHALDAGRFVLAVPGSIHAPGSAGTNRLICDGATPIACDEDLTTALAEIMPPCRSEASVILPVAPVGDPILAALFCEPLAPDELARILGLSVRTALVELGRLEAIGLVVRGPQGAYLPTSSAYDDPRHGGIS